MSVCITFLLATSVWTVIVAMRVDQGVSSPHAAADPEPTPLVLTLRPDGVHVRFTGTPAESEDVVVPRADGAIDKDALSALLGPAHVDDDAAFLLTEDGIAFSDVIAVLDVAKATGFTDTHLGQAATATRAIGP